VATDQRLERALVAFCSELQQSRVGLGLKEASGNEGAHGEIIGVVGRVLDFDAAARPDLPCDLPA
jgi:hypothetical protein